MSLYAIKNDKDQYRDGIKLEWVDEINSHCVVDSVDAANDWNHTCANPLGEVVKLVEEPENGNITSEEAVEKVFREANRRVHNLISDDRFKFEIKMALNAYKHDKKPAPVVVSEAEAEMLEQAKDDYCAASVISAYSTEHIGAMGQDRLMRAYVIGWTVEKTKRYFVRVPHANRHYYYQKCDSGEVIPVWDMETEPLTQFTEAEIKRYGLQHCERVEVTDNEQ